jgi:hypothetical protein
VQKIAKEILRDILYATFKKPKPTQKMEFQEEAKHEYGYTQ